MKTVDIQAFEDRSRPAGGHAVICLVGVSAIARSAAFVLRPLDGTLDASMSELWPGEERAPLETRATETGFELVIGPGVVDNPLLVPGTPVLIDLPHEGLSGEFLWPMVTLPARPRRRSLQPATMALDASRRSADAGVTGASVVPPRPIPALEDPDMSVARKDESARVVTREGRSDVTSVESGIPFYTSARAGAPVAAPRTAVRGVSEVLPKSRGGAVVAAVVSLLALQGMAYMLMSARGPNDAVREAAAKTRSVEPSLFDALRVGDVSPLGVAAASVPPARMLELANGYLFGEGAARNTDEAAFWLKRYFLATTNDERTRRAMTQLGTTFASPSRGAPDYTRARQVWELAAAQGDPVAMCFLARLYEGGLAGSLDRAAAERWTDLARPLGGCSGL